MVNEEGYERRLLKDATKKNGCQRRQFSQRPLVQKVSGGVSLWCKGRLVKIKFQCQRLPVSKASVVKGFWCKGFLGCFCCKAFM